MQLPAELRLQIYGHLLIEEEPIRHQDPMNPGILQACRQNFHEATHIFYESNKFIMGGDKDDYLWLKFFGHERRQYLRQLNLSIKDWYNPDWERGLFSLLSQCSGLSLTIQLAMVHLWDFYETRTLKSFHGIVKSSVSPLPEVGITISLRFQNFPKGRYPKIKADLEHQFHSPCPEGCEHHAPWLKAAPGPNFKLCIEIVPSGIR